MSELACQYCGKRSSETGYIYCGPCIAEMQQEVRAQEIEAELEARAVQQDFEYMEVNE